MAGGPDTGQHGAIVFPEYTAVIVFAPFASCDALSGRLAAEVLALVGTSVCVDSNADPNMNFTVPLGTPPPPGNGGHRDRQSGRLTWAAECTRPEVRSTVNELAAATPVLW